MPLGSSGTSHRRSNRQSLIKIQSRPAWILCVAFVSMEQRGFTVPPLDLLRWRLGEWMCSDLTSKPAFLFQRLNFCHVSLRTVPSVYLWSQQQMTCKFPESKAWCNFHNNSQQNNNDRKNHLGGVKVALACLPVSLLWEKCGTIRGLKAGWQSRRGWFGVYTEPLKASSRKQRAQKRFCVGEHNRHYDSITEN